MNEEAKNPDPIETQDPTPAGSGNASITPPDADKAGTTQPDADSKAGPDQDEIEKIVKKRLERAQKQWQKEREEAEERARMSEAEKLKKDLEAKDAELADARQETMTVRRQLQLSGKVRDPKAAIKLLEDDHVDDDGNVLVDKLLEAYPFLATQDEETKPSAKSTPAPTPAGRRLTEADVRRMTPQQINDNWDRIQADLARKD